MIIIKTKIIKYLTIFFSFLTVFLFVIFIFPKDNQYIDSESGDNISNISSEENNYILNQYSLISSKVIPYIVNAKVVIDGKEYLGEVIEDKGNGKTYHIKTNNNENWYEKYYVSILFNEEKQVEKLLDYEIELYVNFSNFNIDSDYFIWVDLYRIETYLLHKKDGFYTLIKRFECATGKDLTPTKRGFYKIENKGTHFYSRDNTYICYNFLQYSGSYLLHSFPYSLDKKILDDSVGKRVSNGCVRFNFQDSKYLYDNIPLDTNIWIN